MIGVFDSGYGGLTILEPIRRTLPQYDYLYLGDNARAPYGTRSFQVIYEYTLQAVNYLFEQGCRLVILACNTASAKALRTIQMHDINPDTHRVLGVIRPTVESVFADNQLQERHIGILATQGTVSSQSYVIELKKQWSQRFPTLSLDHLHISQQACPMWVPLIESGEYKETGADYFVNKYLTSLLEQDPLIDTILLACTHYPLLQKKIQDTLLTYLGKRPIPTLIAQGQIVADSLKDYLLRHPEIEADCTKSGRCTFLTTEQADKFTSSASVFLTAPIEAQQVEFHA
ncbi:MAG: glutamate racemase [Paludibacteraceae bacterium]|nr:glutamate racemase [Paludibacteraceae bacterium]